MVTTFTAQGFLLAEHAVYESLAQVLMDDSTPAQHRRWSIVCERKEDLLAIRTQIFSLLSKIQKEKNPSQPLKSWAGVSLYTLDTLVRNFTSTLSNNHPSALGEELHRQLKRPFIDVVEQEKLMRLLLLRLGYSLSDVAPLAKQILTLADTPLPADESFLSLLLEVQNSPQSQKSILDIPDSSLRTICVAFQLAQKIFASYGRLQSFVTQYWSSTFSQHLRNTLDQEQLFNDFLLPVKFLSEPLLWIGAPEYCRTHASYRPGNFQASLIDPLRDGLFQARETWAQHHKSESTTWWARTQIDTTEIQPTAPTAHVHVLGSYAALTHHFNEEMNSSGAETQFLLGDLNKRLLNTVRADGSGVHALTPYDFEKNDSRKSLAFEGADGANGAIWENGADAACESSDPWSSPAQEKVEQLRSEFQTYWDKLGSFDEVIQDALAKYDLSRAVREHGVSFDLMLHRFFDSETFSFGPSDTIALLPPALSLLPGLTTSNRFIVLGPPHSSTAPSFHLRLLNSVFHLLRSKQVAIDPIASEESYRGFWQSVLVRTAELTFLIRNLQELKDFPKDIRQWCLPPLQIQTWSESILPESAFEKFLGGSFSLADEQWWRLLKDPDKNRKQHSLSVTAFEDYVECPLQFYWSYLHGIGQEGQPALQPDALITGLRTHSMAEKLVRGIRQLSLLNQSAELQAENSWLQFFILLQDHFLDSEKFMSHSATEWNSAFRACLSLVQLSPAQEVMAHALTDEITEVLFSVGQHESESMLTQIKRQLVRETVRRAFKKLILSELQDANLAPRPTTEQNKTTLRGVRAAFIEQPVSYELHPQLLLTGRIDRVDSHPQGDRIIDYKTSKVGKNDPDLVLDPRAVKSTNKLSVQGAIYSLAWASKESMNSPDTEDPLSHRGVSSFSLLRLKTLDLSRAPFADFRFETPLKIKEESFETLAGEYRKRADALISGDFTARPLTASICTWCSLQDVCPAKGRVSGESL